MTDHFDDNVVTMESPAEFAYAVTPHDTNDLDPYTRGFYVGGEGDVKLDTVQGDTVTLVNCPQGSYHPIRTKRIYATTTTATNIIALY